ncbi:trypsin-like peptidase domain-containing protein [Dictyobacter kobayashii]|uniref:PDZ domain-containing protein n=1 Tax=Dictyobacter kobayashii TaxID=2014872 RepID=A0A402AW87_9CHLR|nr:trypsin-like peptidase domain-containing protein [Dictyobacter kobayashii]GCE23358.1 hypothetical protein KDK_71580 [Dictyobacter kobayashii]
MSHPDQKPDPSESSNKPQHTPDPSSEQLAERTETQKARKSYTPPFLAGSAAGRTPGDTSAPQPPSYQGSTEQPAGYVPLDEKSDIYHSNTTPERTPTFYSSTDRPTPYSTDGVPPEVNPTGTSSAYSADKPRASYPSTDASNGEKPSPYNEPPNRTYYPPDIPPDNQPRTGYATGNASSNMSPDYTPGNAPSTRPPGYTPNYPGASVPHATNMPPGTPPPPDQYAYQAQTQGQFPGGPRYPQRTQPNNRLLYIGLPLLALLMGAIGGWLATSAITHPAGAIFNPAAGQSITQVASGFRSSVVQINVETERGGSLGSGVIIDPRGYIVTNNHVVSGGQNYQVVLYDNTRLPATVAGTDPNDDLAVIKIDPPKHMSVAKIGDSSRLQVGQPVLAIGNPLGITQTVTSGIVSATGRNVSEGPNNLIINAIQTDAAINPGNSGGALVNMQKELVGIPTLAPIDPEFKTPASGVGFAIPSNRVKFIAPQLINSGHVVQSGRADMGVNVITVDSDIADQAQLPVNHGALIVNVRPDSAAAQAGLRRGDIIVEADNQPIQDTAMLQDILINKQPGQTLSLRIYRGDQQMAVKVQLGEQQFS